MWDGGFFWLFLILFFVFGPFSRRRRGRGRWWWGQAWDEETARPDPGAEKKENDRARQRDEQVLQLETRVAELESRLDFAERLLAQRRDPALPAV